MNIMDPDIFYDRYIADDFETKYIPKCFERICKQYLIRKEPITESIVQNEIRQVKQTGLECYRYGFFSRSGFTCGEGTNRILIELRELYK